MLIQNEFIFFFNNNRNDIHNQLTVLCVKRLKYIWTKFFRNFDIYAIYIIPWISSGHIWTWKQHCVHVSI